MLEFRVEGCFQRLGFRVDLRVYLGFRVGLKGLGFRV